RSEAEDVGLKPDLQNLPWIHDSVLIDRLLDRAHQLDRDRVLVAKQLAALQLTDPVLRAEAPAVTRDQIVYSAIHLRRQAQEFLVVTAARRAQVEMQVAVAEMPVRNEPCTRCQLLDQSTALDDEARQLARR